MNQTPTPEQIRRKKPQAIRPGMKRCCEPGRRGRVYTVG